MKEKKAGSKISRKKYSLTSAARSMVNSVPGEEQDLKSRNRNYKDFEAKKAGNPLHLVSTKFVDSASSYVKLYVVVPSSSDLTAVAAEPSFGRTP